MIICNLSAPFSAPGAVLSALIIVCSAIGLTLHSDVYAHRIRKDYYYYYTHVSNLLVLFYFALAAPLLYANAPLRCLIPTAEFCVAMSILLTGVVFHLMIFPGIKKLAPLLPASRETQIMAANNVFVHYLVPWMTFFYWLFCSPGKAGVPMWASVLWTALPAGYVLLTLLRGRTGQPLGDTSRPYPYPFLDAGHLGMRKVLLICLLLFALCVLFSGGLLLLFRGFSLFFGI